MSDVNGGFSFGAPAKPTTAKSATETDDFGEVDAVEVSGEPVSRNEAKSLGLASPDNQPAARSATAMIRLEELPEDVGADLTAKLEKAWNHLKRNEIEEALTLAQEAVWEYPSLVAAKLIIARCFINRKEYDKALAILQAIPDADKTPESLYYLGLSQSRLGKIKEAIESLKLSRLNSNDALIRKRANDLLMHLQGEQTVCPVCGKKTLYDSMVEVGNRSVCATCGKIAVENGEDEEGDGELDEEEQLSGGKRRKRLRPPLSKSDLLIRALFVLFLVLMLCFGVYILYLVSPGYYSVIRSFLPASWHFLPQVSQGPSNQLSHDELIGAPRVIPTMVFDSPGIDRAIAGVEIRRTLKIEGMSDREGVYGVTFSPKPESEYRMNAKTGEFAWTPSLKDSGRTYDVSFSAVFKNIKAKDQDNRVKVSSGPEFRRIASPPGIAIDSALHLVGEELTGDKVPDVLVVSGDYWRGDVSLLTKKEKEYQEVAHATLTGRPIGAGIITAGDEKWLAVADYWNSRLRFFGFRNGSLSEMATSVELPGRPLLAGFWRDGSVSAILCRLPDSLHVLAFKQDGQLSTKKLGEWLVPEEFVWRRLFVLHGDEKSPVSIVLLGGDFTNSLFILESGKEAPRQIKNPYPGTLIDASLTRDGRRIRCLAEHGGALTLYTITFASEQREEVVETVSAGSAPALGGISSFDLTGNGSDDILLLTSSKIGFSFAEADAKLSAMTYWPLPSPARLFGQPISQPSPGNAGNEVIYADMGGDLWSVKIAD